jgi:chromate transporter
MIYFQLFWVYLKIGLFSFGGGYAMLSFVEYEVVRAHSWISPADFADIVAISQMTPGPIGINTATYVGYAATGSVWGSIISTIAVCLPSLVIMVLICRFLVMYKSNRWVAAALAGIKPVTVGLLIAAAFSMVNSDTFVNYISVILFLVSFLLTWKLKVHPILMLILAGIAGYVFF